jgi:hypothetical protein
MTQVMRVPELTARYQPLIRAFIDDGLASGQHQFITEQQAFDLKVRWLRPIYIFGRKSDERDTFRMTPDGSVERSLMEPGSTFSSGADAATFKYITALAAHWNLEISGSDVTCAFPRHNNIDSVHVQNHRLVVMRISAFVSGTGKEEILLLNSYTNGLPDASAIWEGEYKQAIFNAV